MLMVTGGVMLMATGGASSAFGGICPSSLGSAKKTRPGGIAPLGGSPFSVKKIFIVFLQIVLKLGDLLEVFAAHSIQGFLGEC